MNPLKMAGQFFTKKTAPFSRPGAAESVAPDEKQGGLDPLNRTDEGTAPEATDAETRLVGLVDSRFKDAYNARRPHEDRYKEAYEFVNGNQWITAKNGKVSDLRDKTDPSRWYSTSNRIAPMVRRLIAKIAAASIAVQVSPLTGLEADIDAAGQARALLAHWARVQDDTAIQLDCIHLTSEVGPVAVLDWFDPDAIVSIPQFENGEFIGLQDGRAGELDYEIYTPFELYPDPSARIPSELRWVITARKRTLSDVRSRWPEIGKFIKADGDGETPEAELSMSLGGDEGNRNTGEVVVKTLWELPEVQPLTPEDEKLPECQGRYVVTAGGRVLYSGPYPYRLMLGDNRRMELPFSWLCHERNWFSFWGNNAVNKLVPAQRERNRILSEITRKIQDGMGFIMAPSGAEIKPDEFKSSKRNKIVYWLRHPTFGDLKPDFFPNPPLDPTVPLYLSRLDDDMNETAEMQDISKGKMPGFSIAAATVAALKEADDTTISLSIEELRKFALSRARHRLALGKQFYQEERLILLQDTEDNDPPERARVFKEFGDGRYILEAEATTPQSPAVRIQTIMDLAKSGAFQPQALSSTKLLLKLMDIQVSDKQIEEMGAVVEEADAKAKQEAADAAATEGERMAADTDAKLRLADAGGAGPLPTDQIPAGPEVS